VTRRKLRVRSQKRRNGILVKCETQGDSYLTGKTTPQTIGASRSLRQVCSFFGAMILDEYQTVSCYLQQVGSYFR